MTLVSDYDYSLSPSLTGPLSDVPCRYGGVGFNPPYNGAPSLVHGPDGGCPRAIPPQ